MKKSLVQQIQPDPPLGPVYGQVSNPADFMKAQIFAHEHAEVIARDWLVGACAAEIVAGFDHALPGGMQFRVLAPGHIVDEAGKSYEIIGAAQIDLAIAAAHATLPRIDLVVAVLEADVDAAAELRPFVRLRTQQELEGEIPPYPPTQFNEPTEQHTRAVVQVKTGTPANPAVPPALASNEIVLYSINIAAAITALTAQDVTDLRNVVGSLCVLQDRVDQLRDDLNTRQPVSHRHPALDVDIGAGAGEYEGKTVQQFINDFVRFSDEDSVDPLTRPETLTSDGKVGAVAALDGSTPVADIPVGVRVAFSDRIVSIETGRFPSSVNARMVNKSGSAGTETRTNNVNFSMAAINSIESDGGGDFALKAAKAPAKRLSPASAARDGRYIETYGGSGLGGSGLLSDWFTYDTLSDSVTVRTISGTVPPAADRPFMAPCGDGNQVLLATAGSNGQTPRWFLCNCSGANVVVTEKFGGPTTGYSFFIGDLVQANIILIVAVKTDQTKTFWVYHVDTGTFEQITTAGIEPNCGFEACDACLYQTGQLVVLDSGPPESNAGVNTFLLDYPTLTWSRLFVPQPQNLFANPPTNIFQFRMANVNGRPLVVGGSQDSAAGVSVWELSPGMNPSWRRFLVSLPRRWQVGLASLLSDGFPRGQAFVIAGRNPGAAVPWTDDIFVWNAGGVIETLFNGQTALTLGPNTTQATFRVADFAIDWGAFPAAKVLATLVGDIPAGTLILAYSFDGVNFQVVPRDQVTSVLNSSSPPVRVLKITLISAGSAKPVLRSLTEQFERSGGPSFNQLVIRYDVPLTTKALFIQRDGTLLVEDLGQTTIDKALLVKTTHNGTGVNPTVENYRNFRHRTIDFKGGPKVGGVDPTFEFDFAVAPKRVKAFGVFGGATGNLFKIADPAINFDGTITVTGLANGDHWIVEVEA